MNLAAFELRGLSAWDRRSAARGAELIDHAGDQRAFGPDDGEVGVDRFRDCEIVGRRRSIVATCAMPGLPGAAKIWCPSTAPAARQARARARRCR